MADDPLLSSLNDQTLSNAQGIGDSMADAADAARRLNLELKSSTQLTVEYSKLFSGIKTSASAVAKIQDKAKLSSKAVNDATREQIKNLTSVRELNAKIEDLYNRARKASGETKDILLDQAKVLAVGRDNAKSLADTYGNIAKDATKLNRETSFFNLMSDFVKDVPGLRVFSKPFQDAATAARETAIENAKIKQANTEFNKLTKEEKRNINKLTEKELQTGFGLSKERLKQLKLTKLTGDTAGTAAATLLRKYKETNSESSKLGAGIKAFAKSAKESTVSFFKTGGFLAAIPGAIGLLAKGLKSALKFLLSIDERAANLAKSLNMTKLEAASFDKATLRASGGIDYLNNRLGEAADLAAAFADNTGIISTNLRVFNADLGVINRRFGLSTQQTSEIAKNMLISGQSSTEFAANALGAAEALEMQNGINLQSQVIMKDIADLSAVQFLNLNKQPDAIARAVTQARRFGLTMSTIEGIQGNLLNFSQSITDEINAELLLGRSLNLDRARAAALQNDYATVAAEIAKEIGTAKDFTKLNYIQQTALAKAVGMTRDELAKSLKEQEALEAAGFASADAREKKYQALRKRGLSEKQALKEIGMAEFTRQKQNISFQEKFNNLVHNLKMIFVQSINPILQKATTFLEANPKFIKDAVDAVRDLALKLSDFFTELLNGGPMVDKFFKKFEKFGYITDMFRDFASKEEIQAQVEAITDAQLNAIGKTRKEFQAMVTKANKEQGSFGISTGGHYFGMPLRNTTIRAAREEIEKANELLGSIGIPLQDIVLQDQSKAATAEIQKENTSIDKASVEEKKKTSFFPPAFTSADNSFMKMMTTSNNEFNSRKESDIKTIKATNDITNAVVDTKKTISKQTSDLSKGLTGVKKEIVKAAEAGQDVSQKITKDAQGNYVDEKGNVYKNTTEKGVSTTVLPVDQSANIKIRASEVKEDTVQIKTTDPAKTKVSETTNQLLTRLIEVVEKGGDVFIDGRKVGEALVLGNRSQG